MSEPTNQAEKPCLWNCECRCGYSFDSTWHNRTLDYSHEYKAAIHVKGCPNPTEKPCLPDCWWKEYPCLPDGVWYHAPGCPNADAKPAEPQCCCSADEINASGKWKPVEHATICPKRPTPPPPVEQASELPIDPLRTTDAQEWARGFDEATWRLDKDILALKAERDSLKHDIACLESKIKVERDAGEKAVAQRDALAAQVSRYEDLMLKHLASDDMCTDVDEEAELIRARRKESEARRAY